MSSRAQDAEAGAVTVPESLDFSGPRLLLSTVIQAGRARCNQPDTPYLGTYCGRH